MVTDERTRGQLILIAAILVALTVVSAVVLLNVIHESPTLQSQAESQSMTDTEQTTREIRNDLEEMFLVRTSVNRTGDPLPYARDDGRFDDSLYESDVEKYNEQYGQLLADDTQTAVNVDYVPANEPGGSMDGAIAFQNETQTLAMGNATGDPLASSPDGYIVMNETQMLPRLRVNVTDTPADTSNVTLDVTGDNGAGDIARLNVSGNNVTYLRGSSPTTAEWQCRGLENATGANGFTEIDFTDGVGEVRSADSICGNLTYARGLTKPLNVTIQNGGEAEGTYTITGVGDTINSSITDQRTREIPADWGSFDVSITGAPGHGTNVAGDLYTVEVEVENTGSENDPATQNIALRRDDTQGVLNATDVTLSPSTSTTATLGWRPDEEFNRTGVQRINVTSDSASDDRPLNLGANTTRDLNQSNITVEITDVSPSKSTPGNASRDRTVTAGNTIEVTVNATNIGNKTDEMHTVGLENFDGNVTSFARVANPEKGYETTLTWQIPDNESYTDRTDQINVRTGDNTTSETWYVERTDPANTYNPFFYEKRDGVTEWIVVNPKYDISIRNPDISYQNSYYLYNRTAQ